MEISGYWMRIFPPRGKEIILIVVFEIILYGLVVIEMF